jgi:hypothetical protein
MNQYLVLAYVIGLGLLWGATVQMWMADRALSRREQRGGAR